MLMMTNLKPTLVELIIKVTETKKNKGNAKC